MKNKQILFFATHSDMQKLLGEIFSDYPFKLVCMNKQDDILVYNSPNEYPCISESVGDSNLDLSYLLIPMESLVNTREIKQKNGVIFCSSSVTNYENVMQNVNEPSY